MHVCPRIGQSAGPHTIVAPHPLGTVPQSDTVGQLPLGVQPHALGPMLPPPQVSNPMHVLLQVMVVPQLLVAGPQAFPLQVMPTASALQPHALGPTPPPPQVLTPVHVSGQVMVIPQLLVAGPQAFPLQVVPTRSGVQPQ